jgi:hypothetical protein
MTKLRPAAPKWSPCFPEPCWAGGGLLRGHVNLELAYRLCTAMAFGLAPQADKFAESLPLLECSCNVTLLASMIATDLLADLQPYGVPQDLEAMTLGAVNIIKHLLAVSLGEERAR